MAKITFNEYGYMSGKFPKKCITDCTHSGDCFEDVKHWVNELNFNVPGDLGRAYLKEFGAWDDLKDCTQETLNQRVLWIACCEIKEFGEWFGLIH